MLALRDGAARRVSFEVRVSPRASANRVVGEREGRLLVRVTAPPAEGAANEAVVALLAASLGVARSEVRVERGFAARTKLVSVPARAREALLQLVK